MKFIKELNIVLDNEMRKKEYKATKSISKLDGFLLNSVFKEAFDKIIVLKEVMNNNLIENIHTTYIQLMCMLTSDNFKRNKNDKLTFNNIEALKHGISFISKHGFISTKLLIKIQQILRDVNEEIRRDPNVVILNSKNEVVYRPPSSYDEIVSLLNELEIFINSENNEYGNLIKMALVHYQFESIHPFSDGNGRTGRILNILFLILKNEIDQPILSLSYFISKNKEKYYLLLNKANKNDKNIKCFINFILDGLYESSLESILIIDKIKKIFYSLDFENLKFDKEKILSLFNKVYFDLKDVMTIFNISYNTAKKYLNIWEEKKYISRIDSNDKQTNYYIFSSLLDFINNIDK